jgi:hypothetical protein
MSTKSKRAQTKAQSLMQLFFRKRAQTMLSLPKTYSTNKAKCLLFQRSIRPEIQLIS